MGAITLSVFLRKVHGLSESNPRTQATEVRRMEEGHALLNCLNPTCGARACSITCEGSKRPVSQIGPFSLGSISERPNSCAGGTAALKVIFRPCWPCLDKEKFFACHMSELKLCHHKCSNFAENVEDKILCRL